MELRDYRNQYKPRCGVSNTPIVDQRQEIPISPFLPEESELAVLIRTCIGASGVICVLAMNCYAAGFGVMATACALILAGYLCIALHEGGHLLAGILLGRKCRVFAVGPVSVSREGSQWKFRFCCQGVRAAGRTDLLPSPGISVAKEMIIVASGPAANALTFLACVALRNSTILTSSFWFWPVAVGSVVLLLENLVPSRVAEIESDGARLISLIRGEGVADCINADLLGRLSRGERPHSWDQCLIERATRAAGRPMQHVVSNWLGCLRAIDVGEPASAASHLETALTHCYDASPEIRQQLFREAAFVHARYRNDMDLAKSWFDRAEELRRQKAEESRVNRDAVLLDLADRIAARQ